MTAEAQLGLSRAEARARLDRFGPNALPAPARASFFKRVLRQFQSALIYLLLLALALDLAAWLQEGAHGVPIEALAILAVLLLNAGLGVLQEYRSESALDELERLGSPRVWVQRDGALEHIPTSEIVPGDVVRLEPGDRVPADGTALHSEALSADESLLTGESLPVEKAESSALYSGTLILRGRGELLVSHTGPASTMGRLAGSLAKIESEKTPLEMRIDRLGGRIARYVAALSLLLVLGGIAVEGVARLSAVIMFAVAFGVAVVPESMPAMMTMALAFGVQRMARKNAVIRRLAAVEALGSITVIASDKTGTLTQNRISVSSLDTPHEPDALLALALVNDAVEGKEAGDPLERGLIEFATSRGADVAALRHANPRISSRPFDSAWKYMRVTVEAPDGSLKSYLKGAAEVVLERSLLTAEERREWQRRADDASRNGFKVLGLASGKDVDESNLTFLGLVSLWDPPRPGARNAVRAAEQARIRVMMLTGDHPETARAIAERVGIATDRVLTGAELDALNDAEFRQALRQVRVYSRLLPQHKLRIVEALRREGEVVAMTGDGLNDAPALKRADVGVAMGQRGSEVAREVADVVLLDDEFVTIVSAIEEGRIIYENILNFIRFTFSSNVALMLLVLGGAVGSMLFDLRTPEGALLLPLTALQVLWINFLGDGPPALALSVDRSREVMQQPPRARKSALLDRLTLSFIMVDGGFKAVVGLSLLALLPRWGASLPETASAVFLYEAVAKLLSVYPARKVGARAARNSWLHVSIVFGLLLAFLCVALPPLRHALGLAPLSLQTLQVVACASLLTVTSGELVARALRARHEQPSVGHTDLAHVRS
ncbi:MAG: cation-translocating P-type ATPase [Myxococcota bacterium]